MLCITITHIPGKSNKEADFGSRNFNHRTEWSLDPSTFELIGKKLRQPEIDLFASYSNAKGACYYSWKPDPGPVHVDALTVSWSGPQTYSFPPFSLLGRCLQKIAMDQTECIVLISNWPTQPYYSRVMEMLVSLPLVLPTRPQLLQLPHDPRRRHPLFPRLQLLPCKLSGNPLRAKTFQDTLPRLSSHLGAQEHRSSIKPISGNKWLNYCCERALDSLHPSVAGVIQFLTTLFKKDLSYSLLNTPRSALSTVITVDGMSIGNHPLVVRFLKGVFNLRPPVPRDKEVWDVSIVLRFLKTLSSVASLSLKSLTLKIGYAS